MIFITCTSTSRGDRVSTSPDGSMHLFLSKLWRNTHTRRTSLFCIYLSFRISQVEMHFEMYWLMKDSGITELHASLMKR